MLSERIFFAIESIGDLFKTFEYDNNIKIKIKKLVRKLQALHTYVRGIKEREGEQLNDQLYLEIIAGDAEDILICLKNGKNPTNPTRREITNLIKRIDRIASSRNAITVNTGNNVNFGGQQVTGSVTFNVGPSSQNGQTRVAKRPSYGHQNCDIVGFEGEIETLLSHIQDDQARVVGIVGMAGSGKTTLAKHLFHHADIQRSFSYKVWVCISQAWDKMEILYEIFRQTAEPKAEEQEKIKSWSEQKLMENLYGVLSEQSYLIILDDLWSVDAWNEISPGIPLSKASKVVVTTRNGVVPKLVDPAFFILETQPLDLDQSYELFRGRTFTNQDGNEQEPPLSELVKLGKEMVEKCRGLPLAITALAGALRVNYSMNHWIKMSETLTQKISEAKDSATQGVVREVLALSYHDLPYHLKQCFLYLAMFPEDHEIRTGMLMRMWIAECLISRDPLPEEDAMRTAEEYLEFLYNRYLIINVKRNCKEQVKAFQLHDLVREMCTEKAKEKGFLKESHRVAFSYDCKKQRRLEEPWLQAQDEINRSRLRSLIVMSKVHSDLIGITELTLKFILLRVLVLKAGDSPVLSLPEAIFELIHLRCLCLEGFKVILPECIRNLRNLLTLDIRNSITRGLKNLWRLRSLKTSLFKTKRS